MQPRPFLLCLYLAFFTLGLTACNLLPAQLPWAETPTPPPTMTTVATNLGVPTAVSAPPANPSGDEENTAVFPPAPPPTATNSQTLTVWTIPALSPSGNTPGSQIMAEQIRAFEAANPNVTVRVELKEASGPGSINSYLSTARPVAPTILPDVILLPVEQMREAANANLIYPANDFFDPTLLVDLYPAAQTMVTANNNLWGIPYAIRGLTHTVYQSQTLTSTLPTTLAGLMLLEDPTAVWVIPAAGEEGSKLLLQYYLQEGGQLLNENGQPTLEWEPLTAALTQLQLARNAGTIHPQSYAIQSLNEAWQLYLSQPNQLALTSYTTVQAQQEPDMPLSFAPVPGINQAVPSLVTGWAWSISTPNPTQQALAADFIGWMSETENMGAWSEASQRLPARRSAFALWGSTPYQTFLQQELERAGAYPAVAQGAISTALSQSLTTLLSPTGGDPSQLAEQAVNALQP
jgi:ABC-type glycerol-3-phosphate transport system substrate-binding protein